MTPLLAGRAKMTMLKATFLDRLSNRDATISAFAFYVAVLIVVRGSPRLRDDCRPAMLDAGRVTLPARVRCATAGTRLPSPPGR